MKSPVFLNIPELRTIVEERATTAFNGTDSVISIQSEDNIFKIIGAEENILLESDIQNIWKIELREHEILISLFVGEEEALLEITLRF